MYHPTEQELIEDALDNSIADLFGQHRIQEVENINKGRWHELVIWYSQLVRECAPQGCGFRWAQLQFSRKYNRENLEHWLKTGEFVPKPEVKEPCILIFNNSKQCPESNVTKTNAVLTCTLPLI